MYTAYIYKSIPTTGVLSLDFKLLTMTSTTRMDATSVLGEAIQLKVVSDPGHYFISVFNDDTGSVVSSRQLHLIADPGRGILTLAPLFLKHSDSGDQAMNISVWPPKPLKQAPSEG